MTSQQAYIKKYKGLAIKEALRSGVPASISLAQGILESASGKSYLAQNGNAHFGIKCAGGWNGLTIHRDADIPNECFRAYPSVKASYEDHSNFLRKYPRYASLFKLPINDFEGWARGLQNAGYAPTSGYTNALLTIYRQNQLWKVDNEVQIRKVLKYVQWSLILLFLALLIYYGYRKYKQSKKLN